MEPPRPQTTSNLEMRSSTIPYRLQTKEPPRLMEVPAAVKLRSASYKPERTSEPEKVTYRFSSRRNVLELVDPTKIPQMKSNFSTNFDHKSKSKLEVVTLRMVSSRAKIPAKAPLYAEYQRKNMNLKSFAEFLCVEPVKQPKVEKPATEPIGVKVKVLKQKAKKKKKTKKKPAIQLLMEKLKAWNLPPKEETRKTQRSKEENVRKILKETSSLFNQVKLGLFCEFCLAA